MLVSVLGKPYQIEPSSSSLLEFTLMEVHIGRMRTNKFLNEIGNRNSECVSDIGIIGSEFSRQSQSFYAQLA